MAERVYIRVRHFLLHRLSYFVTTVVTLSRVQSAFIAKEQRRSSNLSFLGAILSKTDGNRHYTPFFITLSSQY